MKIISLFAFFFSISLRADSGVLATNGLQTNPAANTVLATTNQLSCSGATGCDYKISLILHSSNAMVFRLEALNSQGAVQQTIHFAVPANDTKIATISSTLFLLNGWTLRILNNTAQNLGATSQASIIYQAVQRD